MTKTIGISEAEKDAIIVRVEELRRQDAVAIQELADSTHNGAETWHDNAAFDAAKDKKNLAQLGLGKLLTLLRRSKVVEIGDNPAKVMVGTQVKMQNCDNDAIVTINIAGDAAWLMGNKWASAQSPIGQAIMGAKVGNVRRAIIGTQTIKFKILEIKPA